MRPHLLQYDRLPRGPFRIAVLLACLATIAVLGLVRVATEAQFAFASLMLVPVLLSAWYVGPSAGWGAAGFATGLWAAADYGSFESKSLAWVPFVNAAIRFLNYGLVIEMARRLQRRLIRESTEATVDILTGLPNRRGFLEAAEREIEYARRLRWPVALVYIDLDRFKVLNDTCGHEAGDAAFAHGGRGVQIEPTFAERAPKAERSAADRRVVVLPHPRLVRQALDVRDVWELTAGALAGQRQPKRPLGRARR